MLYLYAQYVIKCASLPPNAASPTLSPCPAITCRRARRSQHPARHQQPSALSCISAHLCPSPLAGKAHTLPSARAPPPAARSKPLPPSGTARRHTAYELAFIALDSDALSPATAIACSPLSTYSVTPVTALARGDTRNAVAAPTCGGKAAEGAIFSYRLPSIDCRGRPWGLGLPSRIRTHEASFLPAAGGAAGNKRRQARASAARRAVREGSGHMRHRHMIAYPPYALPGKHVARGKPGSRGRSTAFPFFCRHSWFWTWPLVGERGRSAALSLLCRHLYGFFVGARASLASSSFSASGALASE